jgi:hypothetical protein
VKATVVVQNVKCAPSYIVGGTVLVPVQSSKLWRKAKPIAISCRFIIILYTVLIKQEAQKQTNKFKDLILILIYRIRYTIEKRRTKYK